MPKFATTKKHKPPQTSFLIVVVVIVVVIIVVVVVDIGIDVDNRVGRYHHEANVTGST